MRELDGNAQLVRPRFSWSETLAAPLHDLPIRDEMIYQFLPLSPEMEVVECGPGAGFTTLSLAKLVRSVVAVDIAAASLDALRASLSHVPNVDFVCADLCVPGLRERVARRFDVAIAIEVLELLPDPGTALQNMASLLRPGGRLFLQFPNYAPPRNLGNTYFQTRNELEELLQLAGFRSWNIYGLQLRGHAQAIYHLHEAMLHPFRRRSGRQNRPQTYEQAPSFQSRGRLEKHKTWINLAWYSLGLMLRLGGDCFERSSLEGEIFNRNLLLTAEVGSD